MLEERRNNRPIAFRNGLKFDCRLPQRDAGPQTSEDLQDHEPLNGPRESGLLEGDDQLHLVVTGKTKLARQDAGHGISPIVQRDHAANRSGAAAEVPPPRGVGEQCYPGRPRTAIRRGEIAPDGGADAQHA